VIRRLLPPAHVDDRHGNAVIHELLRLTPVTTVDILPLSGRGSVRAHGGAVPTTQGEGMPTVEETSAKIQEILRKSFGKVTIDDDGDFVFPNESTVAFGRVHDWGHGDVLFGVFAPVLRNVPITNELCRYVATEQFALGHLTIREHDGGSIGELQFEYNILANDIDASEVEWAVTAVAGTANELDNKLQKRFGGELTIRD